jgi:hypothetical protein
VGGRFELPEGEAAVVLEGGIIDAAQMQGVVEAKRLEWIGAKKEFGLCCSLQEWLRMDGIDAVDVAED